MTELNTPIAEFEPIILSVEELARAIHGDDEMQGEAFSPWDRMPDANRDAYRSNAKAVLDLITSRASTWVPQQPQPIVLPSVEDVMQAICCMDYEGVLDGPTGVHRNMAQAALDLVASRVPVWVPVEPGTVVKKGTRYRVEYPWETVGEYTASQDFRVSGSGGRTLIDTATVPVDDPVDDQVERVAKALHGADKPDHPWEDELGGTREIYRRLARVALEAAE